MMKKDILSMLPAELESEFAGLGEPKYRQARYSNGFRRAYGISTRCRISRRR